MKKAIALFESIQPVREEIRKRCISYLRRVLKNRESLSINFYTNNGDAIDDLYVTVSYDGGRHPEYASSAFSNVNCVYINDKGRIVLDIDDCEEYEIENITFDELYALSEFVYKHALPYWKNA
jgi:hypothetical protein